MELKCKEMKELVWQTCLKRNQIKKKNSYKKNKHISKLHLFVRIP